MKRYEAYLFDLDGTLVDSAPDLHQTLNRILEAESLNAVTLEEVRNFIGEGARRLLERSLTAQGAEVTDARLDRLLEAYLAHYGRHFADHSRLFPKVRDSLGALQKRGAKLAVVTNKFERLARAVVAAFELQHHFPVILGGDTLPERKPSALPVLEACARLGVALDAAVMIGDSVTDVGAARAAKIDVFCVPYGYNHGQDIRLAGADGVITDLSALVAES
jgi:phosphoglycolate phosphatase